MSDRIDSSLVERYEALWALWRAPRPGSAPDWDTCGIHDPEAGLCVNNHYALSHLMLAAGLLHELTGEAAYADQRDAMAALLLSFQACGFASYDPNTIHWDFNNAAWLGCALLPGARTVAALAKRREASALGHENGTWAGNWLVMRQVNRAMRSRLGLRHFNWRHLPERWLVRRLFRADGGSDEFPDESRPIQYHAYVVALLLRRFLCTGRISATDERRITAGTGLLLAHIDDAGNANYRGRGQYQLFFEGCARYLLTFMAAWHHEAPDGPCRTALAALDRQVWPRRPDGLLALVRTDPDSQRTGTHYDYHYPSVYNAFDLAWRLLAAHDAPLVAGLPHPHLTAPIRRDGLWPDSGTWFIRVGEWLLAVTAGEPMYLSDVGLTVCHLGGPRGILFTAPGGPHPTRYGSRHGSDELRQNVFGPLLAGGQGGGLPHFSRGRLAPVPQGVRCTVANEFARLDREITVAGGSLRFHDKLVGGTDAPLRRIFNWALPAALGLEGGSGGRYTVVDGSGLKLAQLVLPDARDELTRGELLRGPGGPVRPWFLNAEGAEDSLTFTLELPV